jgi:hypothetical protein
VIFRTDIVSIRPNRSTSTPPMAARIVCAMTCYLKRSVTLPITSEPRPKHRDAKTPLPSILYS